MDDAQHFLEGLGVSYVLGTNALFQFSLSRAMKKSAVPALGETKSPIGRTQARRKAFTVNSAQP
jgi:hypothetical protein